MAKDKKKTSKNDVQQGTSSGGDTSQQADEIPRLTPQLNVRDPVERSPPLTSSRMPILQQITEEQQTCRSGTPGAEERFDQINTESLSVNTEQNGRLKRPFKIPKINKNQSLTLTESRQVDAENQADCSNSPPKCCARRRICSPRRHRRHSSRREFSRDRKSYHGRHDRERYGGRGQKRCRSPTPDYEYEDYEYEHDYDDYEDEYSDEYGDYDGDGYYDDDYEFSDDFEEFHDTESDHGSRGKGSYAGGKKKGKAKPKRRSNGQPSRVKDWEPPKTGVSSDEEDDNDGEDPWTRVQKKVSAQLYLRDLAEKEKRSKENQEQKINQNAPSARQPASAALGAPPVDGQAVNPGGSSENTGREPGELADEDWYTKAIALATTVYDKESQKDKKINDSYANIIDEGLRAKPKEERFKMMTTKYKVPENVPNLQVPRTNPEVWENLHRGTQMLDNQVQRVQLLQVNALSVILRIIDEIGTNRGGLTESHLEELTDANRMLSMGFSSLNQVRKEAIRNAMGYPLAKMCGWDTPVGSESLFPDLSKKLKEKDEVQFNLRRRNRYNRRWGNNSRGRIRGRRRGRGGGRVRGRGGRVSRGRGRKAKREE